MTTQFVIVLRTSGDVVSDKPMSAEEADALQKSGLLGPDAELVCSECFGEPCDVGCPYCGKQEVYP